METKIERFARLFGATGEAVHDAGEALTELAQYGYGVVPSFAGMYDDRQIQLPSEFQLFDENFALLFAWRKVVMIIEADLTKSYDFWMHAKGF